MAAVQLPIYSFFDGRLALDEQARGRASGFRREVQRSDSPSLCRRLPLHSKMRRRFGENEHRIGSKREGVALRAGTQAANA